MAKDSKINWTNATWNPTIGCTKVSPGCENCYAEAWAKRTGRDFANVYTRPKVLQDPAKWKEPALIFVNSLSDLFHMDIPRDFLEQVWSTMIDNDHHIYQVLSKRPHRMAHILKKTGWPIPPHIWLGTSVEDQKFADNRIPALKSIDAPIRFLSCEPLLGPLNLQEHLADYGIHWVIAGGESGPRRNPADYDWFRGIRDDCQTWDTPFFFKQGNHQFPGRDRELDGRLWEQYPPLSHPALDRMAVEAH